MAISASVTLGGGQSAGNPAGNDKRPRLRFSRISIARCADLSPLLRVCPGASRHRQSTPAAVHAPGTNAPRAQDLRPSGRSPVCRRRKAPPPASWSPRPRRDAVMPPVRDRAGQFSASFDAAPAAAAGIQAVKIAPRSPRANAYAQRFVRTARTEATGRMLIFGERHLRPVLAQYARHYNARRPHRSRGLRPPRPDHPVAGLSPQQIRRRSVLGGLPSAYQRVAQKPSSTPAAEF